VRKVKEKTGKKVEGNTIKPTNNEDKLINKSEGESST